MTGITRTALLFLQKGEALTHFEPKPLKGTLVLLAFGPAETHWAAPQQTYKWKLTTCKNLQVMLRNCNWVKSRWNTVWYSERRTCPIPFAFPIHWVSLSSDQLIRASSVLRLWSQVIGSVPARPGQDWLPARGSSSSVSWTKRWLGNCIVKVLSRAQNRTEFW